MKYENKTFQVSVGSKEYQEGWEQIFGKKSQEPKNPSEKTTDAPDTTLSDQNSKP